MGRSEHPHPRDGHAARASTHHDHRGRRDRRAPRDRSSHRPLPHPPGRSPRGARGRRNQHHHSAPTEQAWRIITDHRLYGQLAPNLSDVTVTSSHDGAPRARQCTSTGGKTWNETCTLWDEGRGFAIDVDTSTYPYPLRSLAAMWSVEPAPSGSSARMRFAYQPLATPRGGLFAIMFRAAFPPILRRIEAGWAGEARRAGDRGHE
ncbi:SRPBCC family protein [Hoyosella sp. G463]|uniref:SRPBCC family protein n=1 Tax=Lolliginicoccus lacisalsi TaxID=2742202 RepID=A0A927J983_9ACTN|nr:SRPBCC family protein [Lolliginicoccus lacisalsi]